MTPLFIIIFLVLFGTVLAAFSVGFKFLESSRGKTVAAVLKDPSAAGVEDNLPNILSERPRGAPVGGVIGRFSFAEPLQTKINQAGLTISVPGLIAVMLLLALGGILVGSVFPFLIFRWLTIPVMAFVLGTLPLIYVAIKRRKRFAEFEEQFPEALDFLARSMRAGHAFSISLEMLGQESPDPVGHEFRTLFHELNLGSPVDVAMKNLVTRVPLVDTRFFVSSVMLQRQTGGNLSEILTRLAYVIRERFKLKGQVRAASAHGRITAGILTVLPIATLLGLYVVAPGYLQSMAHDPDGKWLIVGAFVGQGLGYYTMKRIINIKV